VVGKPTAVGKFAFVRTSKSARNAKGNPICHLESEHLKSGILDPDGRPGTSTKGFIRQALGALCVLGGSLFWASPVQVRSLPLASERGGIGAPKAAGLPVVAISKIF